MNNCTNAVGRLTIAPLNAGDSGPGMDRDPRSRRRPGEARLPVLLGAHQLAEHGAWLGGPGAAGPEPSNDEPLHPELAAHVHAQLYARGEPTTELQVARLREILPRSASIIEALRDTTSGDHPGQHVLDTANDLAAHHQRQWHAEDASRAPGASGEDIAASKRLIDALNARRVALVEQIDDWVATQIHSRADASLHTETLGSVIDRLAIAWVRANSLINTNDARDLARLALRQLAELAGAYDDLIRDIAAGHRRLPAWRPLKTYRSTP